jgi:hypothetical protein
MTSSASFGDPARLRADGAGAVFEARFVVEVVGERLHDCIAARCVLWCQGTYQQISAGYRGTRRLTGVTCFNYSPL